MDGYNYTIGYVAKSTGLSPLLIRAWETRYAAIVPKRSQTNRRLYSDKEVKRLKLLTLAIDHGHRIGDIAKLGDRELRRLAGRELPDEDSVVFQSPGITDRSNIISEALEYIKNFDKISLENMLSRLSIDMHKPLIISEVILPLLSAIGDAWESGKVRISNEHFASSVLQPYLSSMLDRVQPVANAPVVVVCTPRGQQHTHGALAIAVLIALAGYRILYLGANLPAEEIISAAKTSGAIAIAMSIVYPAADPKLIKDLDMISGYAPVNYIFVGGAVAQSYLQDLANDKIWHTDSLESLREALNELRRDWGMMT